MVALILDFFCLEYAYFKPVVGPLNAAKVTFISMSVLTIPEEIGTCGKLLGLN